MLQKLTRNGTADQHSGALRVYGGDPDLVHIPDGMRGLVGDLVAASADSLIRAASSNNDNMKLVCPGCYMIALFNASIELARQNGQPLSELANTMANAYRELAEHPALGMTEEIQVMLDGD